MTFICHSAIFFCNKEQMHRTEYDLSDVVPQRAVGWCKAVYPFDRPSSASSALNSIWTLGATGFPPLSGSLFHPDGYDFMISQSDGLMVEMRLRGRIYDK